MADKRIARAEHDGTEGTIIAPEGRDASALLRGVAAPSGAGTDAGETVHVEWTTTTEQYFSADVDLGVWASLTTKHDSVAQEAYLSGLESRQNEHLPSTVERIVMGIGVNE